jgi:hypothetical protein
MAGTVACALQHTPWHTPAACGHGVCLRLHGRCLRLHGRCHGRCFAAHAMAHATGLWPWRVLALAWRVLALAWRVLALAWQVPVGGRCHGRCQWVAGAMAGAAGYEYQKIESRPQLAPEIESNANTLIPASCAAKLKAKRLALPTQPACQLVVPARPRWFLPHTFQLLL